MIQLGLWIFTSNISYEMIFHAAFSKVGSRGTTLKFSRPLIWSCGLLFSNVVIFASVISDKGNVNIDSILTWPMFSSILVGLFYASAAWVLNVNGGNSTNVKAEVISNDLKSSASGKEPFDPIRKVSPFSCICLDDQSTDRCTGLPPGASKYSDSESIIVLSTLSTRLLQ